MKLDYHSFVARLALFGELAQPMLKKSSASPWPEARRRGFSVSSPRVSELIFRRTSQAWTFR